MTKTIKVVCAIIERDGKFLVAKRSQAQSHGGFWEFPGGKIDPGEDAENALVREITEELGARVAIVRQLPPTKFDNPDPSGSVSVTLIPFVCSVASGDCTALEHEEIRWVDKREAAPLAWLPPDAEILKNYVRLQ
jgi:8-oxo-dGTP diphosphatase